MAKTSTAVNKEYKKLIEEGIQSRIDDGMTREEVLKEVQMVAKDYMKGTNSSIQEGLTHYLQGLGFSNIPFTYHGIEEFLDESFKKHDLDIRIVEKYPDPSVHDKMSKGSTKLEWYYERINQRYWNGLSLQLRNILQNEGVNL